MHRVLRGGVEGNRGGEVYAADFGGEFLVGVFEEAEAEAGHVDFGVFEVGQSEDCFEAVLLVGEAHVAEAEDGADDVEAGLFFEDGDDGLVVVAGDVYSCEEGWLEGFRI